MVRAIAQGARSALLVSLLLWALPAAAQADRIIVGYHAADRTHATQLALRAGAQPLRALPAARVFDVPRAKRAVLIRQLRRSPGVRFVEPDYRLRALGAPNDPQWPTLWGMAAIGVAGAWDLGTGEPVTVAVIDTGVALSHEDLQGQLWTNPGEVPGNGVDDEGDGIIDDVHGADFSSAVRDGDPSDGNGHGTHVAGTIAATRNNALGVAGVAPAARIMALRFLGDKGSGSTSDAVAAIDYAVAHGAKILSNSWGGPDNSQALSEAITRARSAGVLFVAAAGNDGVNLDAVPTYPAAYPQDNILTVAASNQTNALASFSNYSASAVDMAAPGVGVLSTWKSGGYASLSGTSMATPHVSGAAAWLWGVKPGLSYQQLKAALLAGGQDAPQQAGKTLTGKLLNLPGAYNAAGVAPAPTPTPPPTPAPGAPTSLVAPSVSFRLSVAVCNPGSWSGRPRLTYGWTRGGREVAWAGSAYPVLDGDYSRPLACQVTATNAGGSNKASSPPATVPTPEQRVPAMLVGVPRVGMTLMCLPGLWLYGPLTTAYLWQRDGSDLPGTAAQLYTLTSADAGHALRCRVSVTGPGGQAAASSRSIIVRG